VRVLVAALAAAGIGLVPAAPAAAVDCVQPGPIFQSVPWQDDLLAPQRVWLSTRGDGIRVAVLDSGVDASQPQLKGHVESGFDAVTNKGSADTDCLGSGTAVAGVIAAKPMNSTGLVGLAPGVTIVPIRVVADSGSSPLTTDPEILARGITAAVNRQVDVIVVSVITYQDKPVLAAAVADAQARGVVVVAAAGDLGDKTDADPDPFPARYPGVIGVGAIDRTGQRWAKSQYGPYVDLVAPGADVWTLTPGHGMISASGTGLAAGIVGATAALVRAKRSDSVQPNEVAAALLGTTTPSPAGPGYGKGIVNPAAAINNDVVDAAPVALPPLSGSATPVDDAAARRRDLAIAGAGVALVVVLLIVVGAATLPRGRRRFWRAIMAPKAPPNDEPDEPGPPLPLFEENPNAT
jgi:type VII secretion-associated serine protease mycosin